VNLEETLQMKASRITGVTAKRKSIGRKKRRGHEVPAALVAGTIRNPSMRNNLVNWNREVTIKPDFQLRALVQLQIAALHQEACATSDAGSGNGSNRRAFAARCR